MESDTNFDDIDKNVQAFVDSLELDASLVDTNIFDSAKDGIQEIELIINKIQEYGDSLQGLEKCIEQKISNIEDSDYRQQVGIVVVRKMSWIVKSMFNLIDEYIESINQTFDESKNVIDDTEVFAKERMCQLCQQVADTIGKFKSDTRKSLSLLPIDQMQLNAYVDEVCGDEIQKLLANVNQKVANLAKQVSEDKNEFNKEMEKQKNSIQQISNYGYEVYSLVYGYSMELLGQEKTTDLMKEVFTDEFPTPRALFGEGGLDIGGVVQKSSELVKSGIQKGSEVMKSALNTVKTGIETVAKVETSIVKNAISTAKEIAKDTYNAATKIAKANASTAKQLAQKVYETDKAIIGKLAQKDIVGALGEAANGFVDAAKLGANYAKKVGNTVVELGKNLVSDVADGIKGVVGTLKSLLGKKQDNDKEKMNKQVETVKAKVEPIPEWLNENAIPDSQDPAYEIAWDKLDPNPPEEEETDESPEEPNKWKDDADPDEDEQYTTQMGDEPDDPGMKMKGDKGNTPGWEHIDAEIAQGVKFLMHDGDQTFFNPYGHPMGAWTTYSFRPADSKAGWPQISITPASFEALDSMETMLNNIPYVVVKEYFFKNTASQIIDLITQITDKVKEAATKPEQKDNQGAGDAKETGGNIIDKIKEKFETVPPKDSVIDIPYALYCGLRRKMFGHTYIFPYLVNTGDIINQSSNQAEWNGKGSGISGVIKNAINAITQFAASTASAVMGSDARAADLFPAPTWDPNGDSENIQFQFDLILINDNAVKARNNYMCVNTIINNNRQMQKAILRFPGALYEIWLPTGQRHLMCTGKFDLSPIGLNRKVPPNFFDDTGVHGANFEIGASHGKIAKIANKHQGDVEVVPDAYKLAINFKSCLANNLNTSVFQYYVEMTGYPPNGTDAFQTKDQMEKNKLSPASYEEAVKNIAVDLKNKIDQIFPPKEDNEKAEQPKARFARAIRALVENESEIEDQIEKFEESTYNKKLEKLKSSQGDQAINSDSVVDTIRKTQGVIDKSNKFLSKLYDAENNNLWYKPYAKEEYYTTLNPEYRQVLSKQYREKFDELIGVDEQIDEVKEQISRMNSELDVMTLSLDERNSLVESKVDSQDKLDELIQKRDMLSDQVMQLDVDLIQVAFDQQDDAVSLKKNKIGGDLVNQVWNEKIMNSYEKDKLQYMTSKEKEIYFKDKIRELKKYDIDGLLNNRDWFFRIVVLDFIVGEMKRLVLWFKDCSYDDIETIYKIVRKLNLLHLDLDEVRQSKEFQINRTHLFTLSDEFVNGFTSIDSLLNGSTLYKLFQEQMEFNSNETNSIQGEQEGEQDDGKKELAQEQRTEEDTTNRRTIRQKVIVMFWGSEANLTKAAYDYALTNSTTEETLLGDDGEVVFTGTIKELKDEIIKLKLNGGSSEQIQTYLGAFTQYISLYKEKMVMDKMKEIDTSAVVTIDNLDQNITGTSK